MALASEDLYVKRNLTINDSVPWFFVENKTTGQTLQRVINETGMLNFGIGVVCYVTVLAIAILLNVSVLVAYLKHLKKSIYIFATALSICELTNCFAQGLKLAEALEKPPARLRLLCLIYNFFTHFGTIVSAGLVFCIALDRFLRTKCPNTSMSPKLSVSMVIAILFTAVVVMTPYIIAYASEMIQTDGHSPNFGHRQYTHVDRDFQVSSWNNILLEEAKRNRRLFLLSFYGVIIGCLGLAFIGQVLLYIKLICILIGKAKRKVPKLKMNSEILENSEDEWSVCTSSMESLSTPNTKKSKVPLPFRKDRINCSNNLSTFVRDGSFRRKLQDDKKSENMLIALQRCQGQKETLLSKPTRYNSTEANSKSLTSPIASVSIKSRRFTRNLIMLLLSVLFFLFYFPAVAVNFVVVWDEKFIVKHYLLSDILRHSQTMCYLANPVIYGCFNRGFTRKITRCCCCYSSRPV